jgi:outer membrane protein assembly factor BamB
MNTSRSRSLAVTLVLLLATDAAFAGPTGATLLVPGTPVELRDFGEAPRDATSVDGLLVVVGERGGVGGIDPVTGLTRWKRTLPGLGTWWLAGETLFAVGDSLTRLSLTNGEPRWEYSLGCAPGQGCNLHVLAHDAETAYLGGIGATVSSLMLLDLQTGRELWPSWLPVDHPVQRLVPGERRLLVLSSEGGVSLSALNAGSGLRAWTHRFSDAPADLADVVVADRGEVVCLSYAVRGAPTTMNLDLLDGPSGSLRLSRTLVDQATPPRCVADASGLLYLAADRGLESLALATLKSAGVTPLPGRVHQAQVARGGAVLTTDGGLVHADASTGRLERLAPTPFVPGCRVFPGGYACGDAVVSIEATATTLAVAVGVAERPDSTLVAHAGRLYALEADRVVPFRDVPSAELAGRTLAESRTLPLPALADRVRMLGCLATQGDAPSPANGALERALAARLLLAPAEAEATLARLAGASGALAARPASALLTFAGPAPADGAARARSVLRALPAASLPPGLVHRLAAALARGGDHEAAATLLAGESARLGPTALAGSLQAASVRAAVRAQVDASRAALDLSDIDEARDALKAALDLPGVTAVLPDGGDAERRIHGFAAWDEKGILAELKGATQAIEAALAASVKAGGAALWQACQSECDQAAADCRAVFVDRGACAAVEGNCTAGCATGSPRLPTADLRGAAGSEGWWRAVLGK